MALVAFAGTSWRARRHRWPAVPIARPLAPPPLQAAAQTHHVLCAQGRSRPDLVVAVLNQPSSRRPARARSPSPGDRPLRPPDPAARAVADHLRLSGVRVRPAGGLHRNPPPTPPTREDLGVASRASRRVPTALRLPEPGPARPAQADPLLPRARPVGADPLRQVVPPAHVRAVGQRPAGRLQPAMSRIVERVRPGSSATARTGIRLPGR